MTKSSNEYRAGRAAPYVPVPWELIDDPDCDGLTLATYVALKRFADIGQETGARVSDSAAAAKAGCSVRTFRRRREWLRVRKWIEWVSENGRTNTYIVHSRSDTPATVTEVREATASVTAVTETEATGTAVSEAEVSADGDANRGQSDRGTSATVADDLDTDTKQTPPPTPPSPGESDVQNAADDSGGGGNGSHDLNSEKRWGEFRTRLVEAHGEVGCDDAEVRPAWLECRQALVDHLNAETMPDEKSRARLQRATSTIVIGAGTEWLRDGQPLPWRRRAAVFREALISAVTSEETIRHPLNWLQREIRTRVAALPAEPAGTVPTKKVDPTAASDRKVEVERELAEQLMAAHPGKTKRIEAKVTAEFDADPKWKDNPGRQTAWKARVRACVLEELGAVRQMAKAS